MNKRIQAAIILFIMAIILSGSSDTKAVTKWGESFTWGMFSGVISVNKKECWIQHVVWEWDDNTKNSTLIFPSKINNAVLTKVGFDYSKLSESSEADGINLFVKDQYLGYTQDAVRLHLKKIVLPDSVEIIGEDSFRSMAYLHSINIPKGIKNIEGFAFKGDAGVPAFNLPNGLQSIGYRAFAYTDIHSLYVPASVMSIEEEAFDCTPNLTKITVSKANKNYAASGPFLLTKNKQRLLGAGGGLKTYTIPSEVWKINNAVFQNLEKKKIKILSKHKYLAQDGRCVYDKKTGLLLNITSNGVTLRVCEGVKKITWDSLFLKYTDYAERVYLPKTIKVIDFWMLDAHCRVAEKYIIKATKMPKLLRVGEMKKKTIVVPKQLVSKYKRVFRNVKGCKVIAIK